MWPFNENDYFSCSTTIWVLIAIQFVLAVYGVLYSIDLYQKTKHFIMAAMGVALAIYLVIAATMTAGCALNSTSIMSASYVMLKIVIVYYEGIVIYRFNIFKDLTKIPVMALKVAISLFAITGVVHVVFQVSGNASASVVTALLIGIIGTLIELFTGIASLALVIRVKIPNGDTVEEVAYRKILKRTRITLGFLSLVLLIAVIVMVINFDPVSIQNPEIWVATSFLVLLIGLSDSQVYTNIVKIVETQAKKRPETVSTAVDKENSSNA